MDVAKEILRGVAQAQNEANIDGGIEQVNEKRLVQISIANDDNETETAAAIARNFVAQEEVIGVIGHNSSSASLAAAPVYQEGGLVMVTPTSSARELSQEGNYIFRTTPSTRILTETLAKYSLENSQLEKIVICNDSSSRGTESFKEEFSLAYLELGGNISSIECDFSSEQFNPEVITSNAISDSADAFLLVPSVNKINQALEIASSNKNRLPLLGSHSMYTYETLKVGHDDLKEMIIPAAWHPKATGDENFNRNSRSLWGTAGTWRTATAYDATKAILEGIKSSESRTGLQETMAGSGFSASGALGEISFNDAGDRRIKATLVQVRPGEISGTGYDFHPVNK